MKRQKPKTIDPKQFEDPARTLLERHNLVGARDTHGTRLVGLYCLRDILVSCVKLTDDAIKWTKADRKKDPTAGTVGRMFRDALEAAKPKPPKKRTRAK